MKNTFKHLLILFLIVSCNNKTEKEVDFDKVEEIENINQNEISKKLTSVVMQNWLTYYQTNIDSLYTLNNFTLQSTDKISPINGSVNAVFDTNFDKLYEPFLIYNSKKDKYIDLDSYHWSLNKTNLEPIINADQEVNLVDIPNKKITRIAYLGPSYAVEDAYWQNDSIVILLQNSYDNVPSINVININTFEQRIYVYNDTLKLKSNYNKQRILSKLKK